MAPSNWFSGNSELSFIRVRSLAGNCLWAEEEQEKKETERRKRRRGEGRGEEEVSVMKNKRKLPLLPLPHTKLARGCARRLLVRKGCRGCRLNRAEATKLTGAGSSWCRRTD
jgi:hypothetical protein